MNRIHHCLLLCLGVSALAATGCYSADLDPIADGVFACDVDEDCPGTMLCDGDLCLQEVPSISIQSPEDLAFGQSFEDPTNVVIRVSGTGLRLAADDDDPNAGFVRVALDGTSVDITSGAISGGIVVEGLTIPANAGGHRISAQAFHSDGTPFGNESSLDTRLFWINDGQPHVAITSPWPGSQFDLDTPLVDFEAAVLNFELSVSDSDLADGFGHVHLYYDEEFPSCAMDAACDAGYIAVIAPSPGEGDTRVTDTAANLPTSAETSVELTAVLRQNDHSPLLVARGDGDEELTDLVTDSIPIDRIADE